MSTIATRYFSR